MAVAILRALLEPAAVAAIKGEGKSKRAKMETGNLRHRRPVNRR